jgi:hypothetical protein
MTSGFSGSPRVRKGAVVGVDPFGPLASVAIFQYNPDTLSRTVTPRYSGAGGGQGEALRLAGPPTETISATLKLDLIDQMEAGESGVAGAGLTGRIAALEMLVYPKTVSVIMNQQALMAGMMEVVPPMAPLTLFIYGASRVVPVKVESLSITETAHDTALNPIRADVAVSLKVLTYNDLPPDSPGFWAFMAHQTVKETMATVASLNAGLGALGVSL